MRAARLDVEVFHQGYTCKESGAATRYREELGQTAERLEEAVLAFQRIGAGGCAVFHRELEQPVEGLPMFVEKALQPASQGLHTGRLEEDGRQGKRILGIDKFGKSGQHLKQIGIIPASL